MMAQFKLLLIFLFVVKIAFSQDTIVVKMTIKEGLVPFFRSQPTLNLEKDISKFTVVDNLKNFIIKSFSVFQEHSAYQKLQNKLISEQDFVNISNIYDFDSSKIYKGLSKSIVYCLVGISSDDQKIVIIDQNGDFDFNNDHVFSFDFIPTNINFYPSTGFFNNAEVKKFLDEQVNAVKVMAEGFYDTTRYSRTMLFKPIAYNTGVTYLSKIEQELHLSIELYEHLEGTFMLNENKYYLSLYNILPYLSYENKALLKLLVRKEKENFDPKNTNTFKNNSLIIENKKYLIEAVSRFGDEVILRYSKE